MTATIRTPCPSRDAARKKAPRLVLGVGGSPLAAAVGDHFRRLGWDVAVAATPAEAGRLTLRGKAAAGVLAVNPAAESGLLTCAKLTAARPQARVVLVGPDCDRTARFARYAGAAGYLPAGVGAAAVARAVLGN